MELELSLKNNCSMTDFIGSWVASYEDRMKQLPLFNYESVHSWSLLQKQKFVRIFYHARGHFHDFLWYLGNHSEDSFVKELVLKNIAEEFNYSSRSHEQMYFDFAKNLEVDVSDEFVNQINYPDSIKAFNKGHVSWLKNNDHNSRLAAFSAYEKLDNVDYMSLLKLAEVLGATRRGLVFFKVHAKVEHFQTTENYLKEIWIRDKDKVVNAFSFIAAHQLKMWSSIHDEVFN